jgi:hypothetical protein
VDPTRIFFTLYHQFEDKTNIRHPLVDNNNLEERENTPEVGRGRLARG